MRYGAISAKLLTAAGITLVVLVLLQPG